MYSTLYGVMVNWQKQKRRD